MSSTSTVTGIIKKKKKKDLTENNYVKAGRETASAFFFRRMYIMAFTVKTLEFLDENYVRNDREWFKQNKQRYEREVIAPFVQLLEKLAPVIEKTDSELICSPKCIARLYRDARRVKGGAIFRDSLWCSVKKKKASAYDCVAEFYFYVSTRGFGYGCGYYITPTAVMEQLRKAAIDGDKLFKAAKRAYEKQDRFYLSGEMYKKNHFPDQKPDILDWINRRSICLCYDSQDPSELFDKNLFDRVAQDFEAISPVYKFFSEMEKRARGESRKPHNIK